MKVAVKETVFQHSETAASNVFSIKADGKAFRILIDGIYSDKITSCIRELSTNAFDSHAVAKNTSPFYVHLPTDLKPEFYVRDYGVGMDHNKVMNLYSTMFDSDKTGDNEQAGMFGLGSKTPFAYTDQFHVTCYNGETSRLYAAGIGKNGVPEIHLFLTEPCTEAAGVKVGFSVQSKDFQEFKKAAGKISLGFPVPFDCNVNLPETLGKPQFKGTDWAAYNVSGSLGSTWMARQGCVLYPITNHAGVNMLSDNSRRTYILDCPIGTLEVTTARESLAYTPNVVAYLNTRFDRIKQEAADLIWKEVKDIENVHAFFDKIAAIKPGFLRNNNFTHPITKLEQPAYRCTDAQSRYAVRHQQDGRWVYDNHYEIKAEPVYVPGGYSGDTRKKVYDVLDISAFLDVNRKSSTLSEFSEAEARRIARYIRLWMEDDLLREAEFYFGIKQTDAFWKALCPNTTRVPLTTADIMKVIPKPKEDVKPLPFVRGLSLVEVAKGSTQQIVEKIDPSLTCAWVPADTYRHKADRIIALAKRFKIAKLYVASVSVVKKLTDAKIPTLQERIGTELKSKYDMDWTSYITFLRCQRGYNYRATNLVGFVEKLLKNKSKALDRLTRSRTPISLMVKTLVPFIESGLHKSNETEHLAVCSLTDEYRGIKDTDDVTIIVDTINLLSKNPLNHAVRFLNGIDSASEEDYESIADAIVSLFKTFPLKY